MSDQIRLQVIIARAGIASRRAAEELITAGRVTVNGKVVTKLGSRADPSRDVVVVDGQPIGEPPEKVYLLLYKPPLTVTTTKDPEGRQSVLDLLPPFAREARVYPVGRLDWETEGALLLTNDGPLANALTHPRYGVERVYHAKLRGKLSEDDMVKWLQGAELEDGLARASHVELVRRTREAGHTWMSITLTEGRNREVRRLGDALGQTVLRLRRVAFAGLDLSGLEAGQWRLLEENEVDALRRQARKAGATVDFDSTTLPQRKAEYLQDGLKKKKKRKKEPDAGPTS